VDTATLQRSTLWNKKKKNEKKHRAVSLQQLSFLFFEKYGLLLFCFPVQMSLKSVKRVLSYSQKNIFQYDGRPPSGILKFHIWSRDVSSSSKYAVVYCVIVWCFSLRYGYSTIFKMAPVRHLDFVKSGHYVMWPLLPFHSASLQDFAEIRQSAAQLWPKNEISIWRPSAILNFYIRSCVGHPVFNVPLCTKFH